ncbi:Flagellum-specific ATP synthase [Yokenella regensburgei]|nr:Flagellum-specific ATP synthase [Yokenella regensburgei]
MTARLTRWLTTLDNFETRMAQLPAVRRYGRLTRATGLVLEATGLQLPLGATCIIERQDGTETQEVESEVVGFNGHRLFLMPLEEVEGVLPGARVYARNSTGDGLQSGKQLPLGLLCSVACSTAAVSHWMACLRPTLPRPARLSPRRLTHCSVPPLSTCWIPGFAQLTPCSPLAVASVWACSPVPAWVKACCLA